MTVFLPALMLLVLAALGGWLKARDVGAFAAAVPIPALIIVLSIVAGLYLMSTEDGTDMRGVGGLVLIVLGLAVAGACFLVAWAMGRLSLRRDWSKR